MNLNILTKSRVFAIFHNTKHENSRNNCTIKKKFEFLTLSAYVWFFIILQRMLHELGKIYIMIFHTLEHKIVLKCQCWRSFFTKGVSVTLRLKKDWGLKKNIYISYFDIWGGGKTDNNKEFENKKSSHLACTQFVQ